MKYKRLRLFRRALPALLLMAAIACNEPSQPADPLSSDFVPRLTRVPTPTAFTVYTQNVYLGGDTGPIFSIDFSDIPP